MTYAFGGKLTEKIHNKMLYISLTRTHTSWQYCGIFHTVKQRHASLTLKPVTSWPRDQVGLAAHIRHRRQRICRDPPTEAAAAAAASSGPMLLVPSQKSHHEPSNKHLRFVTAAATAATTTTSA